MPKHKYTLSKGKTFADALDEIESSVVDYMCVRRGIDEAGMRQLLEKDTEVRASYGRKIQRMISNLIARGYAPSCFTY